MSPLSQSFFFFSFVAAAVAQGEVVPPPAASPVLEQPAALATIQGQDLLAHAAYLASDDLGGRLTGSKGQQAAAAYIAQHFTGLGLEPLGDEVDGGRSFLQHYGLKRTFVHEKSVLELGVLQLREGFAVLGGRPLDVDLRGTLRFCGLGRTKGSSAEVVGDETLAGVIAVVAIKPLRGTVDKQLSVEQKFGMSFQSFGRFGKTAKALGEKGALAVLFVQYEDPMGLTDVLNMLALAPGKDNLSPDFRGAEPGMGDMAGMLGAGDGPPSLVLSVPQSRQLLGELAIDGKSLTDFLAGEGPLPKGKTDVPVRLALTIERDEEAKASNVVAVLRGSDPALAAEAVVYSAHMDHVGRRLDGEVFNGADDNASGSAGLLGIASAFAKSAVKPRRSIVFLSVSGEELGLWGSAYYAANPTWPREAIVANINTDMIGRSGPESGPLEVTVTPSPRHAMFSTIVQDAARFGEQLGLSFTSGDKYYTRSDHYNFARKGIPVVFFCNGEHEDYHQVTDHADKLDPAKMERIARLAFWTGWGVANADERPRKLGKQPAWR